MDDVISFNQYIGKLESVSNKNISNYSEYLDALKQRHDFFATMGCSVSDHGLEQVYAEEYSENEVREIFNKIRSGRELSLEEKNE